MFKWRQLSTLSYTRESFNAVRIQQYDGRLLALENFALKSASRQTYIGEHAGRAPQLRVNAYERNHLQAKAWGTPQHPIRRRLGAKEVASIGGAGPR